MPLSTRAFGHSDVGKCRDNNEDCFLIDEELHAYVVCDGVGGHAAGEVASRTAVDAAAAYLRDRKPLFAAVMAAQDNGESLQQFVNEVVGHAAREVCRLSTQTDDCQGMGTTFTMLVVADSRAVVAHVGDCRVYLRRAENLRLLTSDHTWANEMALSGALSAAEARRSRFRHYLMRSLGREENVDVDTFTIGLREGDRFLICSDGLTDTFEDDDELSRLMATTEVSELPKKLAAIANSRGGKDNITAVVVEVQNT